VVRYSEKLETVLPFCLNASGFDSSSFFELFDNQGPVIAAFPAQVISPQIAAHPQRYILRAAHWAFHGFFGHEIINGKLVIYSLVRFYRIAMPL
jgi:hypothetical protein